MLNYSSRKLPTKFAIVFKPLFAEINSLRFKDLIRYPTAISENSACPR